ncbi:MAG TPA: hypothetical protein VIC33_12275 [Vicinamibacterales bacterium]|jgi:hypothetical protein
MLDPTWLFLSLVLGAIGGGLLLYGRKQGRLPHMAAGVILIVYPYFVATTLALVLIGAAIVAGLWVAVRSGY